MFHVMQGGDAAASRRLGRVMIVILCPMELSQPAWAQVKVGQHGCRTHQGVQCGVGMPSWHCWKAPEGGLYSRTCSILTSLLNMRSTCNVGKC